jgi:hypothetical protein
MEAPSQEIFDKMKQAAIQIWSTYDDTFGYASEKIERVNSLDNIQDNAMVFFRMFDHHNQHIFRTLIDGASYFYIKENL